MPIVLPTPSAIARQFTTAEMERIDNSGASFHIPLKADKFEDGGRERRLRMARVEQLKPGEIGNAADQAETRALRGEDLVKVYGGRAVVNSVNVIVKPGEIVGFLGPNGAGKTTTFYMLVGLLKPDKGTNLFSDDEITTLPLYQRARRGIIAICRRSRASSAS